jgi:cytochrome c peroxidase
MNTRARHVLAVVAPLMTGMTVSAGCAVSLVSAGCAVLLVSAGCAVLLVAAGCAPADGPGGKPVGNVVETIEVIESEPVATPATGLVDTVRGTLAELDKSIAAADKRIEDAAASIPPRPAATRATDQAASAVSATIPGKREQVLLGDPTLTAGVPPVAAGPITVPEIEAWLADPKNHVELEPVLPLGLSQGAGQITGLEGNPLTRAKIELGRQLYFDTRLSADATVSCASCHDPAMGYSANTKTGVGIRGQQGGRNSPVSFNRILSGPQFWDGRADSLEAQAVGPIANPIEMGFTHEGVVERLAGIPVYRKQFETVFGELTIDRVGQAIAAFERALVTAPSPYDYGEQLRAFTGLDPDDIADDEELAEKFAAAKAAAAAHPMSESAVRGRELFFGKANCTACHVGANLADEKYHNLGVGMSKPEPDLGRFAVTKDVKDTGAFKTPTVRNVALTAPYMHDGSQATLEEVVEWYDKGGHPNPHLSDKIKPLDLTPQEKADLVEFMKACTGPTPTVETSRLPADG